jgi:sarcosine oxidase
MREVMATYDAIVVGLGAMGSAAAYCLARRGHHVLGLDAYPERHTFGASHGRSRIIREAYFEAPEYVPLVQRAYQLWRNLESEVGKPLLSITGGITIGAPESGHVVGALESSRLHGLPYALLTAEAVRARYPGLRPTDDLVGVIEPNAGILDPEACVSAFLTGAARSGADLHREEPVISWARDGDGVQVRTPQETYRAQHAVIAAGAWTGRLLPELALPLEVYRVVNVHFQATNAELYQPERCPVHLWSVPEGQYYGFPVLPGQGIKFGRHDGNEVCTPETMRRDVSKTEIEALQAVVEKYLPGAAGPAQWTLTCTYTLTPDENFIIDGHPEHPGVAIGCGFSAHGFKFTPVIGEALADLATGDAPQPGVEFFSTSRFNVA